MKTAAGALFRRGETILLVKPSYLNYWLPPGGGVEPGESPRSACRREVLEEVGITISPQRLLCIDFLPIGTEIGITGSKRPIKQDELVFMFDGGILSDSQIEGLRPDGREIVDILWLLLTDAIPLLPNYLQKRLPRCIDAQLSETTLYLESGDVVDQ